MGSSEHGKAGSAGMKECRVARTGAGQPRALLRKGEWGSHGITGFDGIQVGLITCTHVEMQAGKTLLLQLLPKDTVRVTVRRHPLPVPG